MASVNTPSSATPSAFKPGAANGPATGDVERQMEAVRKDIAELTKQVGDLMDQAKDSALEQVKGQARRAKASVDSALSDASDKGREAVDAVRDVADTFGEALEDSLQRRPYATLALAAGLGFLFGATWRR